MVSSVCRLRPTHIFEWGTHIGKSARIFFEISKKFGINSEIHSTDLPDTVEHVEHPHNERGKFVKGINEVKLYQGDGLIKSLEICASIGKNFNALFFVDGDHGYETVKHELTAIIKAVPNANILLHDTFYQSPESGYYTGPYQAVVDTLSNINISDKYSVISTNMCLPGMTLLYKL
jgi:cephalosporin hydroxylase